jgi:Tol biopolymer transport system component
LPVSGTFGKLPIVTERPVEKLVFTRDDHVFTMFDNNTVATLTSGPTANALPRWSPGGQKILYGHTDSGFPANDGMWVMNPDGTDQVRVWDATEGDWSPDGNFIVFVSAHLAVGNPEAACPGDDIFLLECHDNLYILDLFTGAIRQLTYGGDNNEVSWSPDGSKIAFTSDRDGDWEIFTIKPDGTNLTQITTNTTADHSASWLPNSSGLVYSTVSGGQADLWMREFGETPVQLTTYPGNDTYPAVASDGTIAFARQEGAGVGTNVIYLMNTPSTTPSSTGQRGAMPDWRN